jgi:hypothetical protein
MLQRARHLPLSVEPLSVDAYARGTPALAKLVDYTVGSVWHVHNVWRRDRYMAAAIAASAITNVASKLSQSKEFIAQCKQIATRIWAVADAHQTRNKDGVVGGAIDVALDPFSPTTTSQSTDAPEEQIENVILRGEVEAKDTQRLAHAVLLRESRIGAQLTNAGRHADGVNLFAKDKLEGAEVLVDEDAGTLKLHNGDVSVLHGMGRRHTVVEAGVKLENTNLV